jgi:hypothetical protein
MKKLLILLTLLLPAIAFGQTGPHWLQTDGSPIMDVRNYGLKASPGFNNSPGLASIAAIIQASGGNATVFFPPGKYEVVPGGAATPDGAADYWKAFELDGCDDVTIMGAAGAKIISTVDVGSATKDGQSMDLFYFKGCNNVTLQNLDIDITVVGAPDPGADITRPEFVSAANFIVGDSICGDIVIKNCDLRVYNPISGNGAKQGYEFASLVFNVITPVHKLTGVSIDGCTIYDGQGPSVWFNYSDEIKVTNNRFIRCGGPLPTVRFTLNCSSVSVVGNFFSMKDQPNQDNTGHNYPVYITGRTFNATEPAGLGYSIANNIFHSPGGQAFAAVGGRNIIFGNNIVRREPDDVATYPSTAVAISRTAYEECENVSVVGNTFENLESAAVTLALSNAKYVNLSGNVFRGCKHALNTSGGAPRSIVFSSNTVASGTDNQLLFSGVATTTSSISITGNSFMDNVSRCILMGGLDPSHLAVTGNSFYTNGTNATATVSDAVIAVANGYATANITGNTLRDSGGSAIFCAPTIGNGATIAGNTIIGAGREAIGVQGANILIANNTLLNNNQLQLPGIANIVIATGTSRACVEGNTIFDTNGYSDFGILISSATESLVHNNLLYQPDTSTMTEISSGTTGVDTADNLY